MMEDAVHFLSKDTVVQAITRSATKVHMIWLQTALLALLVYVPMCFE